MMKLPESLVTEHVLQGVPKVTYGLLFALCNKMAAMWSILVAAILFFVRSGCFLTNQSINHFI